jgi:hypothetical protein
MHGKTNIYQARNIAKRKGGEKKEKIYTKVSQHHKE